MGRDFSNTHVAIIRSARKTVAIEITSDLQIRVRAPYNMPAHEIQRFLDKKSSWIEKTRMTLQRQAAASPKEKFTPQELNALKKLAQADITDRVCRFAGKMGVSYDKVSFGFQKTLWGSCSAARSLRFNCLLMCAPPEIRDYVVVHELCHLKQMNHAPAFWVQVALVLPDYETAKQWLKNNGNCLIRRLP